MLIRDLITTDYYTLYSIKSIGSEINFRNGCKKFQAGDEKTELSVHKRLIEDEKVKGKILDIKENLIFLG
ncbi:MAG: hypothetical protein D6734_09405 [Candidatus Schekmanbacteria bacterium]|nr:MAG: hypothetical protein D6734_09405 [Candidatus Schekmanbacteria bacterium]